MRERITFQGYTLLRGLDGSATRVWADYATVYASREYRRVGSGEDLEGGSVVGTLLAQWRARDRKDINARMRLVHTSQVHEITKVLREVPERGYMTLETLEFDQGREYVMPILKLFKQTFDGVTGTTVQVTVNGGVLSPNVDWLDVYLNGQLVTNGTGKDYTFSGDTITFEYTLNSERVTVEWLAFAQVDAPDLTDADYQFYPNLTPFKETFEAVTGTTVTITKNGGVFPSNTDLIGVYLNGQLVTEGAGKDYTVSGSDVIFEYSLNSERVTVKWLMDS